MIRFFVGVDRGPVRCGAFFFPALNRRLPSLKTYFVLLGKHLQPLIGFLRPSLLKRKGVRDSVLRKTQPLSFNPRGWAVGFLTEFQEKAGPTADKA